MKTQLLLIILISQQILVFAHRENIYYLKGELNNKETILKIEENGDGCYGRYFDTSTKFDHALDGSITPDTSFVLHEYKWDSISKQRIVKATLSLHEISLDKWQGTYNTPKGIDSIRFEALKFNPEKSPYKETIDKLKLDIYSAIRLNDLDFKKTKTKSFSSGIKVAHIKDKKTGIPYFRVVANEKRLPNVTKINQILFAEHLSLINKKYSCVNMYKTGTFSVDFDIKFINSSVLSYSTTLISSCYGGFNDTITSYQNRSLTTSDNLILENLIWFDKTTKPILQSGSSTWYKYRYNIFGKELLMLITSEEKDKNGVAGSTISDKKEVKKWQFPKWYIVPNGLQIESNSSSDQEEVESILIPWRKLRPYTTNMLSF